MVQRDAELATIASIDLLLSVVVAVLFVGVVWLSLAGTQRRQGIEGAGRHEVDGLIEVVIDQDGHGVFHKLLWRAITSASAVVWLSFLLSGCDLARPAQISLKFNGEISRVRLRAITNAGINGSPE